MACQHRFRDKMKAIESQQLIGNSVETFTEMIAATPSCLKVITRDLKLLNMNPQGLELIEAENLESVLGVDVLDILEPSHRDNFIKFHQTVCSGQRAELTFEIVGLKGTRRWMESYAAPFRLTNGEIAHLAITNDITNKVEAEQELLRQRQALASSARLASLGQFVGGIAHEINNPLSVILAKLALLEIHLQNDSIDPEQLKTDIHKLTETTQRISDIINNLKTFSRNPGNDDFKPANLREVVSDTLSLCSENFRLKNIALDVDIDPALQINCQKVQISQVLMNLINNSFDAVQSCREKWVKLEAYENDKSITLTITDSGSGIPEEIANNMLNPFFTTKDVGEGTGLGLSISSTIISKHGGKLIYNKSCPNTQFVIELPKQSIAPALHELKAG